jgi:hypothetical protein
MGLDKVKFRKVGIIEWFATTGVKQTRTVPGKRDLLGRQKQPMRPTGAADDSEHMQEATLCMGYLFSCCFCLHPERFGTPAKGAFVMQLYPLQAEFPKKTGYFFS